VGLQVGDELRHRLLAHLRALREHADPAPVVVEVLEHVAVRGADRGVPALGEPLQELRIHRAKRLAQQDRQVLRPLAGGCPRK
jgi:hypothetical protein